MTANSATGGDWWRSAVRKLEKVYGGQRLTIGIGVVVFAAPNQYAGRYASIEDLEAWDRTDED
jgi:hypothetical protein